MASLIKNQILKHLSRFVKNLSADKINISAIKGEGAMTNLELDENQLSDLLELPSWMVLKRAFCNKVSILIPWTKLKTMPIILHLDEVRIHIETAPCSARNEPSPERPSYASGGKYGFGDRVIDGMTVRVNSVIVSFRSETFEASLQLTKIALESRGFNWLPCDLKVSRLKDMDRGEILIFKELTWQTVRIEAKSLEDPNLIPLRLLTNQAKVRITVKKRLSDCAVLGGRIVILLEDLLWVLTDAQLRAAILFGTSLLTIIEQENEVNKKFKALRKLESLRDNHAQAGRQQRKPADAKQSSNSKIFARYDVIETSHHLYAEKIDLHFCDDPGDGRSSHPNLKDGGSLQVTFTKLQLDYYPFHLATGDRNHWLRYQDGPANQWLYKGVQELRSKILEHSGISGNGEKQKVTRSQAMGSPHDSQVPRPGEEPSPIQTPTDDSRKSSLRSAIDNQLRKLMTSSIVLRIHDVTVYRVALPGTKGAPKEFFSGDRTRFATDSDTPLVHLEYTQYFYAGGVDFPLPPPKVFLFVTPSRINLHVPTVLWLNAFSLALVSSLPKNLGDQVNNYMDVRVEALMFRVVFEVDPLPSPLHMDRPQSLHLQIARAILTNRRSQECGSKADLAKCLESMQAGGYLFFATDFPMKSDDISPISEELIKHATEAEGGALNPAGSHTPNSGLYNKELFWTDKCDVWYISLDPCWLDFIGQKSTPVPFIAPLPVSLWVYPKDDCVHVISHISSLLSVQLSHYQYLFLMRLQESVSEMNAFLFEDTSRLLKEVDSELCVAVVLPQIDVSLIMKPSAFEYGSPPLETESVYPETGSVSEFRASVLSRFRESRSEHQFSTFSDNESIDIAPARLVKGRSDTGIDTPDLFTDTIQERSPESDFDIDATSKRFDAENRKTIQFHLPKSETFNSVKRGFASGFNQMFDTVMKITDEASDTLSVRSDNSDESDAFSAIVVEEKDGTDYLFCFNTDQAVVEIADEVSEDSSEQLSSISSPKGNQSTFNPHAKKTVSVVTWRLGCTEMMMQSRRNGENVVSVQVSSLSNECCSSISLEEFQMKFSVRTRGWHDTLQNEISPPCLRMRLESHSTLTHGQLQTTGKSEPVFHSRSPLHSLILRSRETLMICKIDGVELELPATVTAGLQQMFEDEFEPVYYPMEFDISNVVVILPNERNSQQTSSIKVAHLTVSQDSDGLFTIGEISPGVPLQNSVFHDGMLTHEVLMQKVKSLEDENNKLRDEVKGLSALEGLRGQNDDLVAEKESLMQTLKFLQDELLNSERLRSSNK